MNGRRALLLLGLLVVTGSLLAGGALSRSKVEAQLGIRFAPSAPSSAKIGATADATVVDPAKLGAHGFAGLKKGDVVTLKITGPNDQFEVHHGASHVSKSFVTNAQGIVSPRLVAPAQAPAAQQAPVAKTK